MSDIEPEAIRRAEKDFMDAHHRRNCVASIEHAAQRLHVDPIAFAKMCQDGAWLAAAIGFMADRSAVARGQLAALRKDSEEKGG